MGEIVEYHDTGIYDTIKITLTNGTEICGTYDHPIYVRKRSTRKQHWVRLDEVTIENMQVAIPKKLNYFGVVHNPHARLLGMLIGDGNYSTPGTVWYGSEDKELWDYIITNYPNSNIDVRESWKPQKVIVLKVLELLN